MISSKVENIVNLVKTEFNSRVVMGFLKFNTARKGSLTIDVHKTAILINLTLDGKTNTIEIPIPYIENGVEFLNRNDVTRPTCNYHHKESDKDFTYLDIITELLFGNPDFVLPIGMHKSKSHTMQLIKYGYENNSLDYTVYSIQKQINYFLNKLPIHNTFMNSWVMNHRITIIDKDFDEISDPESKHNYQLEKNKLFFNKGWSSLGLSDGSLADANYILSTDLRDLTPFGHKFHNPQRNLYSTLGMKGDEKPLIQTTKMIELEKSGVYRTGWNLFTAFVDIPDVWEDQIMVDESHANKFIEYTKKYICHGDVKVKPDQKLKYGSVLYTDNNSQDCIFDLYCDYAFVVSVKESTAVVGGAVYASTEVVVAYRRSLKDGTKITNLAANKGVIRLKKLGYAIDPRTGKKRKLDVIVSSKAVLKRKNYTQVIEAILNTVNGEQPIIVDDYADTSEEAVKAALETANFNKEGSWECETYVGKLNCVCGKVFWGVTHDADDTIWKKGNTTAINGKGHRFSGLKVSTIEFRALNTRFGNDNPIEKEILSYSQGSKDIRENINILRSKLGKFVYNTETVDVDDISVAFAEGTMYTDAQLVNTVADPNKRQGGFYLKLPVQYQVIIGENDKILSDGFPGQVGDEIDGVKVKDKIIIDKVYVPCYSLRKCWKHSIGKYGMSELSTMLNIIVTMCKRYEEEESGVNLTMIYRSIFNYFNVVTRKLGTKKGDISTLGMSVRYPNSAKAVATLSNNLPRNTVQIHRDMATSLKVKEGDFVLVERFPCLGFMSIRPQMVTITNDTSCRFTIRVSGNSLGSLTLDFDGDVIYLASFRSKEANKALEDEWKNPNKHCGEHIRNFNEKMGTPRNKEMSLSDYGISSFNALDCATHAEIVGKLTGVKSYTGPVVALAYNLLRIMENSKMEHTHETKSGIEVFIDTVANSVFKQKHGKKSLHKVVTDAVCTADVKALVAEGFNRGIAEIVCKTIHDKANERKIKDLVAYHKRAKEGGKSNIINRIVREENKLYFTSRSILDAVSVLDNVNNCDVVDIPSGIFSKIMSLPSSTKDITTEKDNDHKLLAKLNYNNKEELNVVKDLFSCIDNMFLRKVGMSM